MPIRVPTGARNLRVVISIPVAIITRMPHESNVSAKGLADAVADAMKKEMEAPPPTDIGKFVKFLTFFQKDIRAGGGSGVWFNKEFGVSALEFLKRRHKLQQQLLMSKVELFIAGLKSLESGGQLNQSRIADLLRSTAGHPAPVSDCTHQEAMSSLREMCRAEKASDRTLAIISDLLPLSKSEPEANQKPTRSTKRWWQFWK